MEAGYTPLPTFDGRPNVPAILKDMSLEYEQAPEISVHSAGETLSTDDCLSGVIAGWCTCSDSMLCNAAAGLTLVNIHLASSLGG